MELREVEINVINKEIEGENKIIYIRCLQLRRDRKIIGFLISLLSCFIFSFICRWVIQLDLWFYYKECEIAYATHVIIQDSHKKNSILKLKQRILPNSFLSLESYYFTYQYLDFYYHSEQRAFQALTAPFSEYQTNEALQNLKPLKDLSKLQFLFGPCNVYVPLPSILKFLEQEMTSPFYFVQYISVLLQTCEGYVQLGLIMIATSVLTSLINFAIMWNSANTLRKKAHHEIDVEVVRRGSNDEETLQTINSLGLLPGDFFYLEDGMKVPCDCLIISGEVQVDEQTLTGETIPVRKTQVEKDSIKSLSQNKKSILLDGTNIVFAKAYNYKVKGVVLRTGFSSRKGQVFRNALFEKPLKVVFYRDAVKFIFALALFVLSLYFALLYKMVELDYSGKLIFFRFGDAITWIIPPSLVIFINVCMTATLTRLKLKGILGTEPQKNMEGGTIQCVCFDKTGTLTTDQIDVRSLYITTIAFDANAVKNEFHEETLAENINQKEGIIFDIMATCHQICLINNQMHGDPLDISMMKFTERVIINSTEPEVQFYCENPKNGQRLEVLKIFEFDSVRQMMSVIVYDPDNKKTYSFVKGSPEKIQSLCHSIPANYQELLDQVSLLGYRIIALAYKEIQNDKLSESNLTLLGLLIFENKLKQDTPQVITKLNDAKLLLKIITGDSGLTSINCGKLCGIIQQNVVILDYNQNNFTVTTVNSHQQQTSVDHKVGIYSQLNDFILTSTTTLDSPNEIQQNSLSYSKILSDEYDLVVTGKALDILINLNIINDLVLKCKVFARMRPDQKTQVVSLLQQQNINVAMVGDGANDCDALKQANVGISFQSCDASNSAAFSSESTSLECVVQVLLEGKATLANVVEAFKYYMVINVSKFLSVELLMYQVENYNNEQFLFMNYFSNIPILGLVSLTGPLQILSYKIQNSSMINRKNFLPLIIVISCACLSLIGSYFHLLAQPEYSTTLPSGQISQYELKGAANSVLFLSVNLQFVIGFLALYSSKPFKPQFYKAKNVFYFICALFVLLTVMYFFWLGSFSNYLQLVRITKYTKFQFEQYFINMSIGTVGIVVTQFLWRVQYNN